VSEPVAALPQHAPRTTFPAQGSTLLVNGQALHEVIREAGGTPLYVMDRSALAARVAQWRAAMPATLALHYAMKANPHPAVLSHMVTLVDGVDVASAGELRLALQCGADPRHVSFAGPGKRDEELQAAVQAGILVNVESARELPVLRSAAAASGRVARVALRLNPDFELKGSGMRMGGGAKPFGVDVAQAPALLAAMGVAGEVSGLGARHLAFEGFHIYAGSQNLQASALLEAQRLSLDLAERMSAFAPASVRHLNLGGGLGIPYFPGDRHLDLVALGQGLQAIVARAAKTLPEAALVMELGRYLVGEAGIYVARVVDRKESGGQVFLVTDGGLHHHLAASGNFGQVIRKNYPVTVLPADPQAPLGEWETATVVGPLCTPLDVLAERMRLPRGQIGDFVVVFQSGAYGATASPAAFLGHPPVHEVLI
jgi:diaminopimelate decarboxylase